MQMNDKGYFYLPLKLWSTEVEWDKCYQTILFALADSVYIGLDQMIFHHDFFNDMSLTAKQQVAD